MEQYKPLVSVCCIAYNHEKYIRSALEGFVQQKTDFPFEVIVHDDASTDGTAKIIAEYVNKYPDIIIPIFQKENQYKKGISTLNTFIYPKIRGQYVAICEGDDYWCDEQKLQRQADWMQTHKDYSFCVHNSELLNCTTGRRTLFNQSKVEYDLSFENIIEGGGIYFHTSSFFFRKEYCVIPEQFHMREVGDYPFAIYLATCGKVHYFPQVMSVYRFNVEGSYTWRRLHDKDPQKYTKKKWNETKQMLQRIDEYTGRKYSSVIQYKIKKGDFDYLADNGKYKEIMDGYFDLYKQLTLKEKLRINVIRWFPHLINIYRRTKLQ